MTKKTYLIDVEYTVEGLVRVYAGSEEEARELALEEMTFPGTCEMTDWRLGKCREEAPVDEHGRVGVKK